MGKPSRRGPGSYEHNLNLKPTSSTVNEIRRPSWMRGPIQDNKDWKVALRQIIHFSKYSLFWRLDLLRVIGSICSNQNRASITRLAVFQWILPKPLILGFKSTHPCCLMLLSSFSSDLVVQESQPNQTWDPYFRSEFRMCNYHLCRLFWFAWLPFCKLCLKVIDTT